MKSFCVALVSILFLGVDIKRFFYGFDLAVPSSEIGHNILVVK